MSYPISIRTRRINAYLDMTQAALNRRTGDARIMDTEYPVIAAGFRYGVGPDDCACQLIADREDKMARGG